MGTIRAVVGAMQEESAKGKGWHRLTRAEVLLSILASLLGITAAFIGIWATRSSPPAPTGPVAQAPVEDTFIASPVSWGRDLTVTVRKGRTGYKGSIVVFWCNPRNGHYGWIGETAFASASDDFVMAGEYEDDGILIGINVNPEDGDAKTIVSSWDLKNLRQTKAPKARPGTLQCLDLRGDH